MPVRRTVGDLLLPFMHGLLQFVHDFIVRQPV